MTRLFRYFDTSCEVPSYRGLKSPLRDFGFRSEVKESRKQGWGRFAGDPLAITVPGRLLNRNRLLSEIARGLVKFDTNIRRASEVSTSGTLRMKIKGTAKITFCKGNQEFAKKLQGTAIAFD